MKTPEFTELVDLYSADLSRWPQDKIKPALALMENDAAAKAYFDATLRAENALRVHVPRGVDLSALEEKIMARVAIEPQSKIPEMKTSAGRISRAAMIFAPGGGLLAAVLVGFLVGFNPQPHVETLLDHSLYSTEQIIAGDEDLYGEGVF